MMKNTKTKRIGCLGLSANPPHLGHLATARTVLRSGLVDEIWLIPVFSHPFGKPNFAPWRHRLAMTKILEEPGIIVCEIEGELNSVSYTIDTVAALQYRYLEYEFLWIVGSDIVTRGEYLLWHNWDRLKTMIQFIVVERPGYPICENDIPAAEGPEKHRRPKAPRSTEGRRPREAPRGGFTLLASCITKCESSTAVRNAIRNGEDISKFVGDKIADYIICNRLYRGDTREARDE